MLALECLNAESSLCPELQARVSSLQPCQGAANGMPPGDLAIGSPSAGVVVADFNKHFLDSTYHSQLDTNSSVDAVMSAALIAARALHDLASGPGSTKELKASVLFVIARFTNRLLHHILCCTFICLKVTQ